MSIGQRLRSRPRDVLALAVGLLFLIEAIAYAESALLGAAGGALALVALLLIPRVPVPAYLVTVSTLVALGEAAPEIEDQGSLGLIPMILLTGWSLGREARGDEARLLAPVAAAAAVAMFVLGDDEDISVVAVLFFAAWVGGPWAAGTAMRRRQERIALLDSENRQLALEREQLARQAVIDERSRIARELHDVVSHAISVTVLQARGARHRLGISEADVRRALDAIELTNTAALDDMRRLLAALRDTDDAPSPDRRPPPGLADLELLVGTVEDAGVPVTVQRDGTPVALPPGVDLTAYRVVQEALTNVLKHAGPSQARVLVTYRRDALEVRVCDTGGGGLRGEPGVGLIGLRERVAVVGGRLDTREVPGGGFELCALLPYALETS